jgi:hypothetical protein
MATAGLAFIAAIGFSANYGGVSRASICAARIRSGQIYGVRTLDGVCRVPAHLNQAGAAAVLLAQVHQWLARIVGRGIARWNKDHRFDGMP